MKKSKRVEVEDRPSEPVVDAESFGTWLRRQREGRDIGLREISEQSKISLRYLQALETGRFDILPAPVFAKGFLRQYARYVGLDPEEVVNAFIAARRASEEDDESIDTPVTRIGVSNARLGERFLGALLALAALIVLLAIVYLADRWRRAGVDGVSARPPVAESVAGTPVTDARKPAGADQTSVAPTVDADPGSLAAVPLRSAAAIPAPLLVDIDFSGECWIEARVDGKRALQEIRVQGETVQLAAKERVELTFGNGSVVAIEVNGRPFRFDSQPGKVVRSLVIDLATLRHLDSSPVS